MRYGAFDIIGPVMIGPSSSHTAGAVRLGRIAKQIGEGRFNKVDFILHGSFAETYRGHGTDRALVAGILGFLPDDERIRNSFSYAEEAGIEIGFYRQDLGFVHPNTVKIIMYLDNGERAEVTGSSIGGGNVRIINIDGVNVDLNFEKPTILMKYHDQKGVLSFVTTTLYASGYSIENMSTSRNMDDDVVALVVEIDDFLDHETKDKLFSNKFFIFSRYLSKRYTAGD